MGTRARSQQPRQDTLPKNGRGLRARSEKVVRGAGSFSPALERSGRFLRRRGTQRHDNQPSARQVPWFVQVAATLRQPAASAAAPVEPTLACTTLATSKIQSPPNVVGISGKVVTSNIRGLRRSAWYC